MGHPSVLRAAYMEKCGRMDITSSLEGMEVHKGRDVQGRKYGSVTLLFNSTEACDGFWVKTREAASASLADLARHSLILPCVDKRQIQLLTAVRGKYAYDPEVNRPADLGDVHPAFKEAVAKDEKENEELIKELDGTSSLDRICGVLSRYFHPAERNIGHQSG